MLIAGRTGAGRGSLCAAFGDKDGLYLAAVDRYRRDYAEPLLELLGSGAPARDLVRETTNSLEDAFTRVVGDGQARGELSSSAAPRDLARFLIATIHGLRVAGAINPDRRWLMSVVEVAIAALG